MALRIVLLVGALFGWAEAARLEVGPGKPYARPCQAISAARDGDLIEIDARGVYQGDVCDVSRNQLTLRGVNGRPRIDAAGKSSQGKAIWVVRGADTLVENLEFTGCKVPDRNGAGIRAEGRNLTVRDCHFHHNENGILASTVAGGEFLVEYSEFAYNGYGDGYSHNIYISQIPRFILRFCYFHHARSGQLVKSRALENHVLYNRLTTEASGATSMEIDLSNGGLSFVIGNLIHQGPMGENGRVITYGLEGPNAAASHELYVVNNTFVNERSSLHSWVSYSNAVAKKIVLANNIFQSPVRESSPPTGIQTGKNLPEGNARLAGPLRYDYHLLEGSPAIDAGEDPGAVGSQPLQPQFQYVHPACGEARGRHGAIDLGAYEFGPAGSASPPNLPDRCRAGAVAVNGGSYEAGALSPGQFAAVFGRNLARATRAATATPLPTELEGTRVEIGGLPAPLFAVSPGQVNLQVPFEVQEGPTLLTVRVDGSLAASIAVSIASAAPGVFVYGEQRAIAQNDGVSLNGPSNPARPGSTLVAWLTGTGLPSHPAPTGSPAPAGPSLQSSLPAKATLGGRDTSIVYLGTTPGSIGLSQANLIVPEIPAGDHPLILWVGEAESNRALVSVGR